jgi:hypothetical protein
MTWISNSENICLVYSEFVAESYDTVQPYWVMHGYAGAAGTHRRRGKCGHLGRGNWSHIYTSVRWLRDSVGSGNHYRYVACAVWGTLCTLSLTFILLMWRIGLAPNSIPIYIQKYATLHSLFISGNCSTYFGWYFHPSSGTHRTVSTAPGICHTVTAICPYRGRVGTGLSVLRLAYATHRTGLSVLWVAYATHRTLKPVPTLPR